LEFEHLQLDLLYFLQHVHLASALAKKLGQEVSINYIYGLLHRHQWCKLTPRPHHVKQDPALAEVFKFSDKN
jgi:hypothetical protein